MTLNISSFTSQVLTEPTVIVGTLAVLSAIYFVFLLIKYRDGRAIGTSPRPDLDTLPGMYLRFYHASNKGY